MTSDSILLSPKKALGRTRLGEICEGRSLLHALVNGNPIWNETFLNRKDLTDTAGKPETVRLCLHLNYYNLCDAVAYLYQDALLPPLFFPAFSIRLGRPNRVVILRIRVVVIEQEDLHSVGSS